MADKLHVATRKGLFTVERRGGAHGPRWEVTDIALSAQPISALLDDPRDGTLYAALNLGHFGVKLRRSENGGRDWTECAVPVYPKADDAATGTSLVMIWILEGAGPDQPGALWAGTLPGGLFRSDDRGDSWRLVESLWNDPLRTEWVGGGADHPGIHSVCVDPRDSRHVTIGISCGGVWDSRDNGATWSLEGRGMYAEYMPPDKRDYPNTQDPHRLVQCPSDPNGCWVQHHNGIFFSMDGGKTFRSCENALPSKFGFAVAVHPRDPKTAWFVPAVKDETRVPVDGRVVVSRTRDGGETFEVLGNGLPDKHAYDLTFRHCLDIDASGDRLVFGTTTGSLWITEDQGDHWQTISEHLPPVYAVRFAAAR